MTKAEELVQIVNDLKDVVPFLKALTRKEGIALLPTLAQLAETYSRTLEGKRAGKGHGPFGRYLYPYEHLEIIHQAGAVCAATITQFRTNIDWSAERIIVSDHVVEKILPWHVPKWFSRALNSRSVALWVMDYEKLHYLMDQGYYKPTDEIVAQVFERSACQITRGQGREKTTSISYDLLERYPSALKEHFWLLFEHVTAINNRWERDKHNWSKIIPDLIEKSMIPRTEVLKACFMACTKGFNRTQTAWYYRLAKDLHPDKAELVSLQPELLVCLNSSQSSAINWGLAAVRSILDHPKFDISSFIGTTPALLSLPTKSIVNQVLALLDKTTKIFPSHKKQIVASILNALGHSDHRIQLKAAKYLRKNITPADEYISIIVSYQEGLDSEAKSVLAEFLPSNSITQDDLPEEFAVEKPQILSLTNRIPSYSTYDDIVFFLTQIKDDNEHWHAEQLLAILPTLESFITEDNADRLSQAFSHALDTASSSSIWGSSRVTSLYFHLLNDFAEKINKKYPGALLGRNNRIKRMVQVHESLGPPYKTLAERSRSNLPVERMIVKLALYGQSLLAKGLSITILSVPTHTQGWIHPQDLVERILKLESLDAPIDILDWQLAIMRLCPEYDLPMSLNPALKRIKDSQLSQVIRYFYKIDPLNEITEANLPYFLPAIVSVGSDEDKRRLAAMDTYNSEAAIHDYHWRHGEIEFLTWRYNRQRGKSIRAVDTKEVLYIDEYRYRRPAIAASSSPKREGLIGWFKNIVMATEQRTREVLEVLNRTPRDRVSFFDHFDFMTDGQLRHYHLRNTVHLTAQDAKRYLSMVPNNKHLYLSLALHYHMEKSNLAGEDDRRLVIAILEYLIENWFRKDEHEVTYAFLAASILTQQKIARQLVAELWILAVSHDNFDSEKLGRIVGCLLAKKYAPLKRFSDLLGNFMNNLGARHDAALLHLIESTVAHLPDRPIPNSVTLLRIFSELQLKYQKPMSAGFIKKLEAWFDIKSLQKLIKKILPPDKR